MPGVPEAVGPLCLVSLHPHHHNKTDPAAFGRIEESAPWSPVALPIAELIEHISAGKAWVACQLAGGRRSNEAFTASNLIVLDVDGDLDLDAFWAIPFAQRHCAFTYTSCSHGNTAKQEADGTPSADRYRAVFIGESIDNSDGQGVELHRERYFLLLERLGLTLRDESPAKPAQPWYGNDQAELHFGGAVPLGWEFSTDARDRLAMSQQQRSAAAARPVLDDDGRDEERAVYLLDHLLRPSEDGDFPTYWVAVFNACAASGSELVRQAFMDWHSRGHHSKTQKRIEKRYDKAGGRSGLGKLFSLAKEQHGSDWWQLLPEELRKSSSPPRLTPRTIFSEATASTPPPPHKLEATGTGDEPPTPPAPRTIFSELIERTARQPLPPGPPPHNPNIPGGGDGADPMEQLYLLRTFGTRAEGEGTVLLPSHQIPALDRNLLGAILENKGYCNSKDEVERDLLQRFRYHHGLARNTWAPVQGKVLDGDGDIRAEWLVPNWILARREHVIYSKAGVGKTMLSIQLARAITGDPTLNTFLDSEPISGFERWGKRRVLFIGTDMYDSAEEMTNTYISNLGLAHSDFLRYIDWWFEDGVAGTPGWTLSLRHLMQLLNHLKAQQEKGMPVSAVIIDSMKAVCPDHLLVGHQAFKDYLRLVYDICSRFGAALIWIHHSGKDGSAQGIQRITEGAAGVFRMERDKETRKVVMEVEKLRGGGRTRTLFIDPFSPGAPRLLMDPNAGADDEPSGPVVSRSQARQEQILTLLQDHFDAYRAQNPSALGSTAFLLYKGMTRKELGEKVGAGKTTLTLDLQQLVNQGLIESKGHTNNKTFRLRLDELGDPQSGFDPFTAAGD